MLACPTFSWTDFVEALIQLRSTQIYYNINSNMKLATAVLLLACSIIVYAEVITVSHIMDTPNPNDIFKQVQFKPLNPLSFAGPQVVVSLDQIQVEYNGVAYDLVKKLYPQYIAFPVVGCSYSTLGLIRYYSFSFTVQNDTKVAKVAIQIASPSTNAVLGISQDQLDGYEQVSIQWAQKDPKISYGLNFVIKSNWNVIGANPLDACWSKPVDGLYSYRFYFHNVAERFEYNQNDSNQTSGNTKYYTQVAPVFTVAGNVSEYKSLTLDEFKQNPAYPQIVQALNQELGRFDSNWIINFQVAIINQTDCYKVVINFQPFLLKQTYEAYYYGSVQKAALLKIDQQTFNGNGKSFSDWQNIENFDSYKAFHDANAYILSQFTWLRFYKVVAAYSALHMTGRYVRLVYAGIAEDNIDPGNQINIVAYVDECGNYFIDRNDFLATNLNSYGRNDWVSLFIDTPDVSKAKFYQQIVKFFNSIYPKFWGANQLVDIKFKDNLHVVEFRNPTNLCDAVLQVDQNNTVLLNKVNWTILPSDSPLIGRVQNYAQGRYNISKIMFIQFLQDQNGTHFEVSYLDADNQYNAAYILYIQATDVFTDDNTYTFNPATYSNFPLPADLNTSITTFLAAQDSELIAVVGFVALSPNSFAVVGISTSGRWSITIQWVQGKWVVVSRQPAGDGYFKALGYPSSLVASCTGFLSRLYPTYFNAGYVYVSIETRTVGVNIFVRIVYKFADRFVQSVVQVTYGVDNSQVLNEWTLIDGVKLLDDYGYGSVYSYSYGVDASQFYQVSAPSVQVVSVAVAVSSACGAGLRLNIFNLCEPVFNGIAN